MTAPSDFLPTDNFPTKYIASSFKRCLPKAEINGGILGTVHLRIPEHCKLSRLRLPRTAGGVRECATAGAFARMRAASPQSRAVNTTASMRSPSHVLAITRARTHPSAQKRGRAVRACTCACVRARVSAREVRRDAYE
eukprot:6201925-Pleurochrysis_carterae.AAC.3